MGDAPSRRIAPREGPSTLPPQPLRTMAGVDGTGACTYDWTNQRRSPQWRQAWPKPQPEGCTARGVVLEVWCLRSAPRATNSAPRAAQERPRAAQGRPIAPQASCKSGPKRPPRRPRIKFPIRGRVGGGGKSGQTAPTRAAQGPRKGGSQEATNMTVPTYGSKIGVSRSGSLHSANFAWVATWIANVRKAYF